MERFMSYFFLQSMIFETVDSGNWRTMQGIYYEDLSWIRGRAFVLVACFLLFDTLVSYC